MSSRTIEAIDLAPFDLSLLDKLPDEERMMWVSFAQAMGKYRERNEARRGVWRRSGLRGQAFHVLSKAERAFEQVMAGKPVEQDHYDDVIIYSAFAKLLLDEQDLNGEWPWPREQTAQAAEGSEAQSTPGT